MTGDSSGAHRETSASPGTAALDIFICYRRDDSAANAGRLSDALCDRFGRNSVFMDIDTIEPGVDFIEEIERAVGHCDVLIALIGPHWLDATDARGRRLDNPRDLVRLEIETALGRKIRVIPALIGGAEMPQPDELPDALATLARRNALELSDRRFRTDVQLLFEVLEKIAQQKRPERPAAQASGQPDDGETSVLIAGGNDLMPAHSERPALPLRPLSIAAPPVKHDPGISARHDYPPIAPQLHTNAWYKQNPAFTFAVPPGWTDLTSDQAMKLTKPIGTKVLGGVTTHGLDPNPTYIGIFGGLEGSEPDLLSQPSHAVALRVHATRFALGAGPYQIGLGGAPALLFYMSGTAAGHLYGRDGSVPVVNGEAWTVRNNQAYCVMMSGPYDRYFSYLSAFYTVLGTWAWA